MARMARMTARSTAFVTDYAKQSDDAQTDELVIPENLAELSADDLAALHERAVEAFNGIYGDGTSLSDEDVQQLSGLTSGIEALAAERSERDAQQQQRDETAAQLAAKVNGDDSPGPLGPDGAEKDDDADEDEEADADKEADTADKSEEDAESAADTVTASARKPAARRFATTRRPGSNRLPQRGTDADKAGDLVFASEGTGFATGQTISLDQVGDAINHRLGSFNLTNFEAARRNGRHMRQQFGLATIRKPFDKRLQVESNDPQHLDDVINYAVSEKRLDGGSLVASGGWCAPSETLYDLLELESRDGIFSVPEINVKRGGISYTKGPDFGTLYETFTGFQYTEAQDIAGNYGVNADGIGDGSAGEKPCVKIDCPEFEEVRLGLVGLCITAGILQQRGYPEYHARIVRGALVAHEHRMASRTLAEIAAGSTKVNMPGQQVGAIAPLLTSIELQAEHVRTRYRLSRGTSVEAVFPYWVRGAIRADLARRNGVDFNWVTDAQVNSWLTAAGVSAQFVYNYDDLAGDLGDVTAYPERVKFLMYPAGTWVRGTTDVITLDSVYDTNLLGTNDFTALFTEEGHLVLNRGIASLEVSVPWCPDGATAAAVEIACDGTGGGTPVAATTTTTTIP